MNDNLRALIAPLLVESRRRGLDLTEEKAASWSGSRFDWQQFARLIIARLGITADTEDKAERRLLEVLIQHPEQLKPGELERISQGGLTSPRFQVLLSLLLTEDLTAEDLEARLVKRLPTAAGLIEELRSAELPILTQADLARYCRGVINTASYRAAEREKETWLALLELEPGEEGYQKRLVEIDQELYELKHAS